MDDKQRKKRKTIMGRSITLGHCVCDPRKPCPCPEFKEFNVCQCAGENMPIKSDGKIKLTEYVRGAGCASKIGKKDLTEILSGLPDVDDSRILVGSAAGDDAGVIKISEDDENVLILTVDVFAPSVDDPYTFGQIAAANSVSDIYAMGGTPLTALSIVGFPVHDLPGKVMHDILCGGIDKMKEAGIAVIGGHSINDGEIKCGFAVIGTCKKDAFIRNSGAETGDVLVLTKPLGVGIAAFAGQIGRAGTDITDEIAASMASLNKTAAGLMVKHNAHAATDVTGFSLLGHLSEIVKNSKIQVEIDFDTIPLFSGVANLARQEVLPGAVERNREAVPESMLDFTNLTKAQEYILFGPETSGGLLIFLSEKNAEEYICDIRKSGNRIASIIGKVTDDNQKGKIIMTTSNPKDFTPMPPKKQESCCCNSETTEQGCCDSSANEAPEESCCCSSTEPELSESSCCCPADTDADEDTVTTLPDAAEAFQNYMETVSKAGAIDLKNKKLIALALSVVTKCGPCVKINTKAARDAGGSDAEIAEAAAMGIAFGGAPTAMFYNG